MRQLVRVDLVLRYIFLNTKEPGVGVLSPNWEVPYKVQGMLRPGVYELEILDGRCINNPWKAIKLSVHPMHLLTSGREVYLTRVINILSH